MIPSIVTEHFIVGARRVGLWADVTLKAESQTEDQRHHPSSFENGREKPEAKECN